MQRDTLKQRIKASFYILVAVAMLSACAEDEPGDGGGADATQDATTSGTSGTNSDTSGTQNTAADVPTVGDTAGDTRDDVADTQTTDDTNVAVDTVTAQDSGNADSGDPDTATGADTNTAQDTQDPADTADTTGSPFEGLPEGFLAADLSASKEVVRIPASDAPLSDSQTLLSANADDSVIAYEWTVSEAETGAVVMTSDESAPTFTCPADERAAYDVALRITDGQVVSAFHQRRLVTCTLPRTPAGRPVVDADLVASSYFQEGKINGVTVQPGTLVRVRGSISKNFVFFNFHGTAENPIHIINDGPVQNLDASWLFHLTNCRHVIVDGFGEDDVPYGFVLDNSTTNGGQAFWVRFYTQGANTIAAPTGIEVFGVHVRQSPGTGLQVSTDGGAEFNRNTWQMDGLRIHHNRIEDAGDEGFYIGYYTDGVDPPPFKMYGSRIYRNTIHRTGWDCLQVSNSVDLELHHNEGRNCALEGASNQRSTLQFNSGNVDAAVYSNQFIDSNGGSVDMQVGCTGGDALIYSNVFQSPSGLYIHGGASNGPSYKIFGNTFSFTDTNGVRVNRTAAPALCEGTGTPIASVDAVHNLSLTDNTDPLLRVISGSQDITGWVVSPNLVVASAAQAALCLGPASDVWPLRPLCATSTATVPNGSALDALGLSPADLPGGVLADINGRVISGEHGYGAYVAP
jgi:hypothetical protein